MTLQNLKNKIMRKILLLLILLNYLDCRAQSLCKKQIENRNKVIYHCKSLGFDSCQIEITKSIGFRESSMGINLFNPVDNSAGYFGQTMLFVIDINRICKLKHIKKHYYFKDRYNLRKSLEMLKIYLDFYSDWSLRNVCFKWHRSTIYKDNIEYYNLILSEIKIARL